MAGLRLVMGVEVKAGNEHSGSHSCQGLLKLLDELPAHHKPKIVRGDCGFGSDGIMRELEARAQPYLFKLRLSKNVKRHIERLFRVSGWTDAGQGWEGIDSDAGADRLGGHASCRRAAPPLARRDAARPGTTAASSCWASSKADRKSGKRITGYEYAVLVTNLDHESSGLGQLYRDRADCENTLRRAQEPMGLGWLHHARPASLPTLGARGGADLQLVEPVRAPGQPRSPSRGHHQPAVVDVLGRADAPSMRAKPRSR
jgi:hypothetical protein